MEEIIFSLKHYWRFVDSEALELALQNCSCDRTSFGGRASSSQFPFYIWHWQ